MRQENRVSGKKEKSNAADQWHELILNKIIHAYDSRVVRAYAKVRFAILDLSILHLIGEDFRDGDRILDVGCGYGLVDCFFSAINARISCYGCDLDAKRVALARQAARRLHLKNVVFDHADVRDLDLGMEFDVIMMIDLLHHLEDTAKRALIAACARHLRSGGKLIIKDVTVRPLGKLLFTWMLDVLVTRGVSMWYWDQERVSGLLLKHFGKVDSHSIRHWLPYPHVLYRCQNPHPRMNSAGSSESLDKK